MSAIVECVPNFSEGRRPEVIDAITRAITGVPGVTMLSVSSDASHNRTVVTFIGAPEAVGEAAFRSIAVACNRINLDDHEGEHPRIGAADVVPFVPVRNITLQECAELARQVGQRVSEELNQAVYLYEAAATRPERKNLAKVRQGQYELWKEEVATNPDRAPDFGPAEPRPSGATVIGARPFLVAYNVYLNTDDVTTADRIAKQIRHLGGGLRYVKALGLLVDGQAQISMNLTNFEKTPIFRVVELIRTEVARYGLSITHSELIGLIPEAALVQSAQWYLQLHDLEPEQVLEYHLRQTPAAPPPPEPVSPFKAPIPFLDAVASGSATPGGGSVAAMSGALAAGLGSMVARLTIGRKKFADIEEQMKTLAAELDELRTKLTADAETDSAAYEAVMSAYKLPKASDEEKLARSEAIEAATVGAGEVPLRVTRTALEVLKMLETLAQEANPNAITDAGAGAQMARAAVEAAALNVLVNAAGLLDEALAEEWKNEVAELCQETGEILGRIETLVIERGNF